MRALVIVVGLVILPGVAMAGCSSASQLGAPRTPKASSHASVRALAPVSARVVLPARAMAAGSSMSAHVVISNNSGRAIHTGGCLSLFQVALVSTSYHPQPAWPLCLQSFTIRPGQSSYPVTVAASYDQCSQGRPKDTIKACRPGGHPPPLPPGTYRAVLFQSRHLVPVPPAITVRVTLK